MNKYLLIVAVTFLSSLGFSFELQSGEAKANINSRNEEAIRLMRAGAIAMDSYIFVDSLNNTIVLIDTGLYRFSSDYEYIGNRPLTHWQHELPSTLKGRQYANIRLFEESDVDTLNIGSGPGCYGKTPLRYGDIENDGVKELAIWLDGRFIIFSVVIERIVFSAELQFHDYINDEQMQDSDYSNLDNSSAQNISFLATLNNYVEWIPGARVYGKLFEGDFDKDQKPDLLIWQKEFESNLKSNPQPGFNLIGQKWVQYERNDETGEYLPQETDEADIQNWLAENDLTWSKGYPSVSECPGEEGELIPEMHDPLLNDPDVLN